MTPAGSHPPPPLLAVRDARFSNHLLHNYHLALRLGETTFKVSCMDQASRRCVLLRVHHLGQQQAAQRLQAVQQLYRAEPLLVAQGWSSVTLCTDGRQYTLVPARLFQAEQAARYLDFACAATDQAVHHFVHPSLSVAVAFAAQPLLLQWFQQTYDQVPLRIVHQASSLIESANRRVSTAPKVFVCVQSGHLHITAAHKGQLLYYNRFRYANSDELLHYILIVMRALKLDAGFHEVVLGGDVTRQSLAYRKARNYIRHLTLLNRAPYLQFGRSFRRAVVARHWDVLSTHLCQ